MTKKAAPRHVSRHLRDETVLRKKFSQAVSDTGFSHAEIARRAGLSRSTVSYAVNGTHRASMSTWDAILEACGVEIGYRLS